MPAAGCITIGYRSSGVRLSELLCIIDLTTSVRKSTSVILRQVLVPIVLFVDFFFSAVPGDLLVLALTRNEAVLRIIILSEGPSSPSIQVHESRVEALNFRQHVQEVDARHFSVLVAGGLAKIRPCVFVAEDRNRPLEGYGSPRSRRCASIRRGT